MWCITIVSKLYSCIIRYISYKCAIRISVSTTYRRSLQPSLRSNIFNLAWSIFFMRNQRSKIICSINCSLWRYCYIYIFRIRLDIISRNTGSPITTWNINWLYSYISKLCTYVREIIYNSWCCIWWTICLIYWSFNCNIAKFWFVI